MERRKLWLGEGTTYTWNETREVAIRLMLSITNKINQHLDWRDNPRRAAASGLVWEFTREDATLWRMNGLDCDASRTMPKWLFDTDPAGLWADSQSRNYNAVGFACAVMYRMLTGRHPQDKEHLWTPEELNQTIGAFRTSFVETGLFKYSNSDQDEASLLSILTEILQVKELFDLSESSANPVLPTESAEGNNPSSSEKDCKIKSLESFIAQLDLVTEEGIYVENDNGDDACNPELESPICYDDDGSDGLDDDDTDWLDDLDDSIDSIDSDNSDSDESDGDESDSDDSPGPAGQPKSNIEFRVARPGERGFADVAGMEELKQKLEDEVLFVLRRPDLAKRYRLHPANGMILYGPPGCGKTFIAEKFAIESGMKFALIKGSDLGSTYIHGSQSLIADLFRKAERNAPCVLCFDEIDALLPRRSKSDGGSGDSSLCSEVNEMLTQLNNCGQRGIFVIGTTNEPDSIDPAILRAGRLEELVYVPLPDATARQQLFSKALERRPLDADIDCDVLASLTEGYVSSDISLIVDRAALRAARREALIQMSDLREVIARTRHSIPADEMKRYQRMRLRIENNDPRRSTPRPRIGFAANYQDDIR